MSRKETLCWSCQNACNSGCSWSQELKPVDGWVATPTIIRTAGYKHSFIVKACPLYEQDELSAFYEKMHEKYNLSELTTWRYLEAKVLDKKGYMVTGKKNDTY